MREGARPTLVLCVGDVKHLRRHGVCVWLGVQWDAAHRGGKPGADGAFETLSNDVELMRETQKYTHSSVDEGTFGTSTRRSEPIAHAIRRGDLPAGGHGCGTRGSVRMGGDDPGTWAGGRREHSQREHAYKLVSSWDQTETVKWLVGKSASVDINTSGKRILGWPDDTSEARVGEEPSKPPRSVNVCR